MPKSNSTSLLNLIEQRFKAVTGLKGDLTVFPLKKTEGMIFGTDKEKSRDFAEVFTPLHIVDEMINTVTNLESFKNLDLCAGHGQFTIRVLRKLAQVPGFDVQDYLKTKNFFAELQLESCYKLLWMFGTSINLAIGNALELKKLPKDWKGVWLYLDEIGIWVNITTIVKSKVFSLLENNSKLSSYDVGGEKNFVAFVLRLNVWLNQVAKGSKMKLERMLSIPSGLDLLKEWVRTAAKEVGDNWQDVATPAWVAKEMVKCIPDLKNRSRFLVLFNVEFLDALIGEGVDVSRIIFGSDSLLEKEMAQAIYKRLSVVSIGKSFDEMKKALEGTTPGQYDVILSNPPYQMQSGSQKDREGGGKSQAKPIYHEIVMYAIDQLKPQYLCMITPSRWMVGGMGLGPYRERMLADKHLQLIVDYPESSEVFRDASIEGGVSYFLWSHEHNGLCSFNTFDRDISEFDVLIRDNMACHILRKVLKNHKGTFCNGAVLSNKPFGLPTNFEDWVPQGTPESISCYFQLKGDNLRYTLSKNIKDPHKALDKWKVFTGAANGAGQKADNTGAKRILSGAFVGGPKEACTETLIITGKFSTKKEAENYVLYMKTKFYRFMLSLRVISQHINTEKFAWVPDFGDYTNPLTDEDLYDHFSLTKQEKDHINKTIKEL